MPQNNKSLQEMLGEALQNQGVDVCKEQVIDIISNYSIDIAVGNYIRSNSDDEKFNELVDQFTTAYYNLTRYLEKEGLIRINGIQVSKILNR